MVEEVVVIGAGQAGLAVSHQLRAAGIDHVVLERSRIASSWRGRWDSFCLVTPNWFINLPDGGYAGDDPDGYMLRDEVVAHLERYASLFQAPVREGVDVRSIRTAGRGFSLATSEGEIEARTVVVATGAYQRPHRPAVAAGLPARLQVIDVEGYRNPAALAPGRVLVVGSGQSGCQIAEELFEAGRDVVLACGRAPWVPRRIGSRDAVAWALETGFLDQTTASLPGPPARFGANLQGTGHDGGHDLNYRTLQALGVTLAGHLAGADGARAYFAADLAESVAFGDARWADLCGLIRKLCAERGDQVPELPVPSRFTADAPSEVDLTGFGAVVFTAGFRPDYRAWVGVPDAFDQLGFPLHVEGESTAAAGLFFVGVHFLRKRKSSLLGGVGEDAAIVAEQVARRARNLEVRPVIS